MAPRKTKEPAAKTPEVPAEAVTGAEVTSMITPKVLASILALDKRTKKAQSELSGELGQKVSEACERFGTNKKALAIIRSLNRLEPEKLADFLDHFDYMLDISGLEKRAESVQRLPLSEPEAEKEEGDGKATDAGGGVVSHPRFGARAAAPAE